MLNSYITEKMNVLLVSLVFLLICHGAVVSETETTNTGITSTTLSPETTTEVIQTTTPKAQIACNDGNTTTCEKCLDRGAQCYFCKKTSMCAIYPYKHIAPKPGECDSLGDVRWGTCFVNFELLIIFMGVIGGILIIGLIICCCCCCRKSGRDKWAKQQAKWERDREQRKARNEERKKERQAKTDEIRRKYGLLLDASGLKLDDNPYQRFDA